MIKQFKELEVGEFAVSNDQLWFCYEKPIGKSTAVGLAQVKMVGDDIKLNSKNSEMYVLSEVSSEVLARAYSWIEYCRTYRGMDNLTYVEILAALKKYDSHK
jgi:hypothetical protein